MSDIHARARVQLLVEVDAGSPWGDDCTVGQLYKQAADEGVKNLTNALKPGNSANIRIIGEPKVVGVFTEKS